MLIGNFLRDIFDSPDWCIVIRSGDELFLNFVLIREVNTNDGLSKMISALFVSLYLLAHYL